MKYLWLLPAGLLVFVVLFVSVCVHWFTRQIECAYFDSNGVRIHYTDEGNGPPVILIHAYQQNSSINWRRHGILGRVAKSCRVVCIDLRGHGLSQKLYKPEEYGAEFAEDVARLMDYLHIPKARVAGYSLGGLVALKLAERHPERVEMMVLCASGIYHLKPRKPPAAAYLSSAGQRFVYWLSDIDYRCMQACWLGYHELSSDPAKLAQYGGPVKVLMGEKDPMMKSLDEMRQTFKNLEIRTYPGWGHPNIMFYGQLRKDLCMFLTAPNGSDK